MKLHVTDQKLRFSSDSLVAINEVVHSFLLELIWRTSNQATNEGLNSANIEHVEKILPQLVVLSLYCVQNIINTY